MSKMSNLDAALIDLQTGQVNALDNEQAWRLANLLWKLEGDRELTDAEFEELNALESLIPEEVKNPF